MVLLKAPFQSFGRDWDREMEIRFSFFLRPKAYVIYALKKKTTKKAKFQIQNQ